jgi:hypothetical protein
MDRPVLASNPTEPVAAYAAIPDCNLHNREGPPASPSGFLNDIRQSVDQQLRIPSLSVQDRYN